MTNKIETKICLSDEEFFDSLNGLWKGKKPPFSNAIVIRNTNFSNDGRIDLSNVAVLDVETKQLEKRKLHKGDIIVERSGGGPKQPVGRVVYFDVNDKTHDYSFSNFTSVIRVKNKNRFDDKYVFYYLYNFYLQGRTDHLQRRTTGIRNLDFKGYKSSIIFPELSIDKQKTIARQLTIAQNAIAKQEEMIDKLTEFKRNMMHYLFTHGTKGEKTKMTEIGEIPESWEVVELGKVYQFTKKPRELKLSGDVPFIPMENIPIGSIYVEDYITKPAEKITSGTFVENGDLLLAKITPSFENGKQAILKIDNTFSYATTEVIPIKGIKNRTSIMYLFYYLLKDDIRLKLAGKMEGATGRQRLSTSVLEQTLIPLPQYKEQKYISSIFFKIDENIKMLEGKKLTYQNLFKTLLHELMSGEKD